MNYYMKEQLISEGYKHDQIDDIELTEGEKLEKFKKAAKRTAIGLAAGAALAAAPGVAGGIKNAHTQADNRAMDKAGTEYTQKMNKAQHDAKANEMAKNIRDAGIQMGDDIKTGAEKAGKAATKLAGKSKEELKALYEKGKISLEEYKAAKAAAKETIKEEANYFPY